VIGGKGDWCDPPGVFVFEGRWSHALHVSRRQYLAVCLIECPRGGEGTMVEGKAFCPLEACLLAVRETLDGGCSCWACLDPLNEPPQRALRLTP
jgi:hypothetical protein